MEKLTMGVNSNGSSMKDKYKFSFISERSGCSNPFKQGEVRASVH
jgi:hypothetical protein